MEYEARTNCAGAEGEVKMRAKALVAMGVLALLLAGYYAAAQTGEVYSLNVVGFQKLEAKDQTKKYTLVATPFNTDDPNINSVISTQLTGGFNYQDSDNIMKWDSVEQEYQKYFLLGDVGDPNYNHKWIDSATGEVATNTDMLPGEGFWIRSRQSYDQTVVVAGDVVDDDHFTNQIFPGFNLLSYAFSERIALNDTTFTNGGRGGYNFQDSDNIYIWNQTNQQYEKYFLLGDVGDPNYNHKWIDSGSGEVASNAYLEPGMGFWYRHRGTGFAWIEPKPYTEP